MASTASQLAALANDPQFRARVRSLFLQQAAVVYAEAPSTPDTRRNFAKQLLNSGAGNVDAIVFDIANSTNLIGGNVTWDWNNNRPVTDVTDAAMLSQIATNWSMLAGV